MKKFLHLIGTNKPLDEVLHPVEAPQLKMVINWYSPSIIQGMNKALDKHLLKKTERH